MKNIACKFTYYLRLSKIFKPKKNFNWMHFEVFCDYLHFK